MGHQFTKVREFRVDPAMVLSPELGGVATVHRHLELKLPLEGRSPLSTTTSTLSFEKSADDFPVLTVLKVSPLSCSPKFFKTSLWE
ncbi:hypothetical protein [Laspinema palackyanum]